MVYASDPEIGALDQNRIAKVKKLEEIREERPRPTDEQIDHLLECTDARIRPILGFIRETGCRLEEGLSLKGSQADKKSRTVVFSGNTKSGKPRFVPLTDEALQWIDDLPPLPGCPLHWKFRFPFSSECRPKSALVRSPPRGAYPVSSSRNQG